MVLTHAVHEWPQEHVKMVVGVLVGVAMERKRNEAVDGLASYGRHWRGVAVLPAAVVGRHRQWHGQRVGRGRRMTML